MEIFLSTPKFTFNFEMKKVENIIGNNKINIRLFEREKLPLQI